MITQRSQQKCTEVASASGYLEFEIAGPTRQVPGQHLLYMIECVGRAKFRRGAARSQDPKKKSKEIEIKVARRLCKHLHDPRFKALAECLEDLKNRHEHGLLVSVEFLKELLNRDREVVATERAVPTIEEDTDFRVHDLQHTFGRCLRADGVSIDDRQDLLGHKSARITTHCSAAEIGNLIAAANQVIKSHKTPVLTVLNFTRKSVSA